MGPRHRARLGHPWRGLPGQPRRPALPAAQPAHGAGTAASWPPRANMPTSLWRPLLYRSERPVTGSGGGGACKTPPSTGRRCGRPWSLPGSDWRLHLLHDTRAVLPAPAAGRRGRWRPVAGPGAAGADPAQRRRSAPAAPTQPPELETVPANNTPKSCAPPRGAITSRTPGRHRPVTQPATPAAGRGGGEQELNLVAWNSRYVELFLLPRSLVRVGAR